MKLQNTYYLLRHGQAVSNIKKMCSSWPEVFENPLTPAGIKMAEDAAAALKNNHAVHGQAIDHIFASDLLRTRQTAEIVSGALQVPVQFDERLREINFGEFNGKDKESYDAGFIDEQLHMNQRPHGGESYKDVLSRMVDFLKGIESQYQGKHILIVSHQCPLWLLEDFVKEIPLREDMRKHPEDKRITQAELRKLN